MRDQVTFGREAQSGLAAVFLENRTLLLRFLRARGAHELAEDLLQELWLKASANASKPIADPLAYLFRTASNLILDRNRADLRRQRRESDWANPAPAATAEASDIQSGERMVIARDQLRRVEIALAGLGERTESIFRRFRIDGMSQREIAEEFGISLSAVEKHLRKAYRGLVELRRQLDAE
jgi:RNA polymerase sigma factor (sigma-70 family)